MPLLSFPTFSLRRFQVTLLVAAIVRGFARATSTTIAGPHISRSCPGAMELFDNERFIAEVETRPAIWNNRSEAHTDREKRNQAWNELCLKFIPNFAKKSVGDKNILATQLQRKWKSFRDCFKREHAKQIRELQSDSASSTRKTYKYYQNLAFLIKVTEPRVEASPAPQEEKDLSEPSSMDKPKKKRRKTSMNTDMLEAEQEMLRSFPQRLSQNEVEEADRNFVLSLLPHFRHVPHEYKLDAQMEILMVLKKYKPQRFEYFSQPEQHSVIPQLKLSPAASDDGQVVSDDSSINENLYY